MRKKIAVLLCGLCHTNPSNLNSMYGGFEKLKLNFNTDVDYYMHLWNVSNVFPKNYDGPREIKYGDYYECLPIEDAALHNHTTNHIKPKQIIYSDFSEMYELPYYNKFPNYINYTNTLGQFYAFEKLLKSIDFSGYDLILRWRYDILTNHHQFCRSINESILSLSPDKNQIVTTHSYIIRGLGQYGNNDKWFGFLPSTIEKFKNLHKDIHILTNCTHEKQLYVEQGFLKFIEENNLERIHCYFPDKIIRKKMLIPENYCELSESEQNDVLEKFSQYIGPEHHDNGYGTNIK